MKTLRLLACILIIHFYQVQGKNIVRNKHESARNKDDDDGIRNIFGQNTGLLGLGNLGQTLMGTGGTLVSEELALCRRQLRRLQEELNYLTLGGSGLLLGGVATSSSSNGGGNNVCQRRLDYLEDVLADMEDQANNCRQRPSLLSPLMLQCSADVARLKRRLDDIKSKFEHCEERTGDIEEIIADLRAELTACKAGQTGLESDGQTTESGSNVNNTTNNNTNNDFTSSASDIPCSQLLAEILSENTALTAANAALQTQVAALKTACTPPTGVVLQSVGGKNYFLYNGATRYTWRQAQFQCKSFGMELLSINDAAENNALAPLFQPLMGTATGLTSGFWTSGTNQDNLSVFQWTGNGTDFGFTNFFGPAGVNVNERCVAVEHLSTSFNAWQDEDCTATLRYACEMESSCNYVLAA